MCVDSVKFQFLGGYSEAIRAGLPVKFHWGGILKLSELDSLSNFTGGGYSEAVRAGLPVKFHWGGILKLSELDSLSNFTGGGGILNFRIGVFCRIWTKISTTPAGSCITDSLSHTTFVETNKSRKLLLHSQKWSYGLSKYQTCVGTHTLSRNVRQETLKIKTVVTVFINHE